MATDLAGFIAAAAVVVALIVALNAFFLYGTFFHQSPGGRSLRDRFIPGGYGSRDSGDNAQQVTGPEEDPWTPRRSPSSQ